jgi:rhodanese-related sulfurtransferase
MGTPLRARTAARQLFANLLGRRPTLPLRTHTSIWLLIFGLAVAGCATSGGPEPPATGSAPTTTTPGYVRDLPAQDFHDYLQTRPEAFIIDTRPTMQWDDDYGHLDTAAQIPLEELDDRVKDLPTDKLRPIAVYDQLDVRSATAARKIAQLGYREVVTMQGGLVAYRHAGF